MLQVWRRSGIIARFVPEITLSRVRLRSPGCADPHITCPRNMAARFETVWSMETNKGTVQGTQIVSLSVSILWEVSKRQTAFWRRAMASKRLLLNACGARIRA